MNHFEQFDLAPSVDLDVKALEADHRRRSLESHPDRLSGADPRTRRIAAEKTAALNEAVKVLKDPVRRALHVLELKGVKLDTDDAAKLKMPIDFLEEIMERREALDAAKQSKDIARVTAMGTAIRTLKDETLGKAQAALRADDVATATVALSRVRYYTRFLEEVDAIEEEQLS